MNKEEKKAIEYSKNCLMKITMGIDCEFDVNILDALINIIKKLQKENEELRAKWDKDTHILQNELDLTNADKINNYIPVQKVKDKIEEIVEKIKHEENEKVVIYLSKQKNILQKLLESEENNNEKNL